MPFVHLLCWEARKCWGESDEKKGQGESDEENSQAWRTWRYFLFDAKISNQKSWNMIQKLQAYYDLTISTYVVRFRGKEAKWQLERRLQKILRWVLLRSTC